ncbi:MAG: response regulator transcription factor [Rhodospirillaceae bacterium]|nr:response regulator transcription factor [Rhodospirillaceae bacterium]
MKTTAPVSPPIPRPLWLAGGVPEQEHNKVSNITTSSPPHILVVDDDTRLRGLLQRFLSENGFMVSQAADASEARQALLSLEFDLLIVDVMMPGEDGMSLTRSLRETRDVPILMLTAMGETDDRITGLEAGADDYLTKPFEPRELLLRITAILRRAHRPGDNALGEAGMEILSLGNCVYDARRDELLCGEELVRLTPAEASLLRELAQRPGEIFSRESLAAATGAARNLRTVDVQVTRLRKKIESDLRLPRYLQTVRGKGYMLMPD